MFVSDNTVKSAKHYFSDRLKGVFSEREIRMMFQLSLQKRLNLSAPDLLLSDALKLSESDLLFFRSVVKRLLDNEPFQYIYGETEFYGLRLKTDRRALIPRPETEELVDWIVASRHSDKPVIVDLCSGSGCIALALKSKIPAASVTGLDISEEALELSQENAQVNALDVRFEKLDVLTDDLPFGNDTLDVIVSNPPYVLENEKIGMQAHVLSHEPHLALFVKDNAPLVFYDRIARQAAVKLKREGWLYFEINEQYGNEMTGLLHRYGFEEVELKQDLQGKNRMIRGRKK